MYVVLQPNITSIIITPGLSNNNFLLHEFNDTVSLICTAEGGPRIMTRWKFDDGSTVETVANDSSSATYQISSLSTDHTGVYYCEAIIDGMTDTSMSYTLFGECINLNFKPGICTVYSLEIIYFSTLRMLYMIRYCMSMSCLSVHYNIIYACTYKNYIITQILIFNS